MKRIDLLVVAVLLLGASGAFADEQQGTTSGEKFGFKCRFTMVSKGAPVCKAFGVISLCEDGRCADRTDGDKDDKLLVVCDDSVVYNDGAMVRVKDAWLKIEGKRDEKFRPTVLTRIPEHGTTSGAWLTLKDEGGGRGFCEFKKMNE